MKLVYESWPRKKQLTAKKGNASRGKKRQVLSYCVESNAARIAAWAFITTAVMRATTLNQSLGVQAVAFTSATYVWVHIATADANIRVQPTADHVLAAPCSLGKETVDARLVWTAGRDTHVRTVMAVMCAIQMVDHTSCGSDL